MSIFDLNKKPEATPNGDQPEVTTPQGTAEQTGGAPTQVQSAPTPAPEPTPAPMGLGDDDADVLKDIEEDLSEEVNEEVKVADDKPRIQDVKQVEELLKNLSPEAINTLREAFEQTPRRKTEEERHYNVQMRQIDGKIVVAWGKVFFALVENHEERKQEMKQFIPVRFHGETEMKNMRYADFMDAERVVCRIVGMSENKENIPVGETYKRNEEGFQTKQLVTMYVTKVNVEFTIVLPNGEKATVKDEFVNA